MSSIFFFSFLFFPDWDYGDFTQKKKTLSHPSFINPVQQHVLYSKISVIKLVQKDGRAALGIAVDIVNIRWHVSKSVELEKLLEDFAGRKREKFLQLDAEFH